jgi:hypothetical protein
MLDARNKLSLTNSTQRRGIFSSAFCGIVSAR